MAELNVASIQFFSTGDGPGIRSTVFLKGCNLHCPWCHNPETVSTSPVTLFYPETGKTVSYGEVLTVEDVRDRVLEDAVYYRRSGGGVTVSGGEPLLQANAVSELCKQLKENQIHTIIDTAGDVPWNSFEAVRENTDCFFFDWKTPDPNLYRKKIGGDRERIFQNLKNLIERGSEVHVRLPLIPGVNDDPETGERNAELLQRIGVRKIDLLPFHRLGSGKYKAMGIPYEFRDTPPQPQEQIERIAEIYRNRFQVTIEK